MGFGLFEATPHCGEGKRGLWCFLGERKKEREEYMWMSKNKGWLFRRCLRHRGEGLHISEGGV